MLAAGILFTAVDLARCDCVAQGAQASRGFGAAARDRRSAATRMIFGLALCWLFSGARTRRQPSQPAVSSTAVLTATPQPTPMRCVRRAAGATEIADLCQAEQRRSRGPPEAVLRSVPPFKTLLWTPCQAGRTFGLMLVSLQHASFRQSRSPSRLVLWLTTAVS